MKFLNRTFIRAQDQSVFKPGGIPSANQPVTVFDAALTSSTTPATGTLDAFTRATDKYEQASASDLDLVGSGNPAFHHSNGISIEKASTNIQLHSNDFSNAVYSKFKASILTDTVAGPDGESTADTLHEDATAATQQALLITPTLDSSSNYACSIYAQAINRDWISIRTKNKDNTINRTSFDLSNGVVGVDNNDDSGIEDAGGGWYRCWVRFASGSGGTAPRIDININEGDNDATFDGLDQDSLYIAKVQLEKSDYPTSPIDTGVASATRNADALSYDWPAGVVNDFAGKATYTPRHNDSITEAYVLKNQVDVNNRFLLYVSAGQYSLKHEIGGVDVTCLGAAVVRGQTAVLHFRVDSVRGLAIWVDGVRVEKSLSGTDLSVASTFTVGEPEAAAEIKDVKIVTGRLTNEQVLAI